MTVFPPEFPFSNRFLGMKNFLSVNLYNYIFPIHLLITLKFMNNIILNDNIITSLSNVNVNEK